MGKVMSLITPGELKDSIRLTDEAEETVFQGRQSIIDILNRQDKGLLVISGPCSIHDTVAALEYARHLKELQEEVKETMLLVMRVYFEKPRTTIGWKGLINDPDLSGEFNINKGLRKARKLLLEIAELGVPVATELLDPIAEPYISDLLSWVAIGARTSASQIHREMASDLQMAVGFKNDCGGDVDPAINGIIAAQHPQSFLKVGENGMVSQVKSFGNKNCHLVLRGGPKPNYNPVTIGKVAEKLDEKDLKLAIIVDCSHDNSGQKCLGQLHVFTTVIDQITDFENDSPIVGVMLESNLKKGNQPIHGPLEYGVSVTDECIPWELTEEILLRASTKLEEALFEIAI